MLNAAGILKFGYVQQKMKIRSRLEYDSRHARIW